MLKNIGYTPSYIYINPTKISIIIYAVNCMFYIEIHQEIDSHIGM